MSTGIYGIHLLSYGTKSLGSKYIGLGKKLNAQSHSFHILSCVSVTFLWLRLEASISDKVSWEKDLLLLLKSLNRKRRTIKLDLAS